MTVNGEIHRALPEHIVRLAGANQAQYTVLGTVDVQTGKAAEDVAAVLGGGTKVQLTKKRLVWALLGTQTVRRTV